MVILKEEFFELITSGSIIGRLTLVDIHTPESNGTRLAFEHEIPAHLMRIVVDVFVGFGQLATSGHLLPVVAQALGAPHFLERAAHVHETIERASRVDDHVQFE